MCGGKRHGWLLWKTTPGPSGWIVRIPCRTRLQADENTLNPSGSCGGGGSFKFVPQAPWLMQNHARAWWTATKFSSDLHLVLQWLSVWQQLAKMLTPKVIPCGCCLVPSMLTWTQLVRSILLLLVLPTYLWFILPFFTTQCRLGLITYLFKVVHFSKVYFVLKIWTYPTLRGQMAFGLGSAALLMVKFYYLIFYVMANDHITFSWNVRGLGTRVKR